MKKITTIIALVLLSLTSCHKKDCEEAQNKVTNEVNNYKTREIEFMNNPTQANLAKLEEAKQGVQQAKLRMDRVCK